MNKPGHPDGASHAVAVIMRERLEIEAIARELNRPFEEIAQIFVAVDFELRSRACVTDFLPVLVARKVRARFRNLQ
jgi:hypothetical protein